MAGAVTRGKQCRAGDSYLSHGLAHRVCRIYSTPARQSLPDHPYTFEHQSGMIAPQWEDPIPLTRNLRIYGVNMESISKAGKGKLVSGRSPANRHEEPNRFPTGVTLLIDFGSTFTKVLAVDLNEQKVLGRAQSPSTVDRDIVIGLQRALRALEVNGRGVEGLEIGKKLACSSAAGGLRLVAIGLVPELTLEAARRAALGAGAKIVGSYSYELNEENIATIEQKGCDLILLTGGTDGGNKDVIMHNATALASSPLDVPIIIAGNRVVAEKARRILRSAGKTAELTDNVLPELDRINVEPARSLTREVFMSRIVMAKGLDRAQEYVGDILMPTPMATLKAAKLLAEGTAEEPGLGELMVVEVGGATTNVHTVATSQSTRTGVIMKGLPEPLAKRTVEGDLGIRYNARVIVDVAGVERVKRNAMLDMENGRFIKKVEALTRNVGFVPQTEEDYLVDMGLARTAIDIAVERHVGYLKELYSYMGMTWVQYGRDCTDIRTVIGTGGVFAYGFKPEKILEASLFKEDCPHILKPKCPVFYIDRSYVLYGVGLLSDYAPTQALRIAKKSLQKL